MNAAQHYREGEWILELAGKDGLMNANPAAVDFALAHFAAAQVGATLVAGALAGRDFALVGPRTGEKERALWTAAVEG